MKPTLKQLQTGLKSPMVGDTKPVSSAVPIPSTTYLKYQCLISMYVYTEYVPEPLTYSVSGHPAMWPRTQPMPPCCRAMQGQRSTRNTHPPSTKAGICT